MTLENINVEETIRKAREQLAKEKVSTSFKAIMDVLFMLLGILIKRVSKNSNNSSIPPSQDPNRKKTNKRKGNKKGGQKGHKGKNLSPFPEEEVDEIVELGISPNQLTHNNNEQWKKIGIKKRQKVDIRISRYVTEYRAEIWEDQYGNKKMAYFPKGITTLIQYGNSIKAQAIYLNKYQLLPYERIGDYFENIAGIAISPGSIKNWTKELYDNLEGFEELAKDKLLKSKVSHADETGVNIGGKRYWTHVLSNEEWTYLQYNKKRGDKAMKEMGVLGHYTNILVHDHWKPYYKYDNIIHSECNAHILRELEGLRESNPDKSWIGEMKKLLLDMNEWKTQQTKKEFEEDKEEKRKHFFGLYAKLVEKGEQESPRIERDSTQKKRGRVKQTKDRNMLERFINYQNEILRFLEYFECPFTNNLGERDLRMLKVQQKISGCFRSENGAKEFMRIRSYIDSARKHGFSPAEVIENALDNKFFFDNITAE